MSESRPSRRKPTKRLARAWWWSNRAIINGATQDLSFERTELDIVVEEFAESAETFGDIILAIVAEAPDLDSLAYVGTVFLEDAYIAMGPEAMQLFDALNIPVQTKDRILSGFQLPGFPPLPA
jgi:hypothetical protein